MSAASSIISRDPEPVVSPVASAIPSPPVTHLVDLSVTRVIQPIGDRVLVKRLPDVVQRGLIFHVRTKPSMDIVCSQLLARGPDVKARSWDLVPGDYVLHPRACGVKYDGALGRLDWDGYDFVFLHEHELIGVASPDVVERLRGEVIEGKDGFTDMSHR